jgi:hypothetical protein
VIKKENTMLRLIATAATLAAISPVIAQETSPPPAQEMPPPPPSNAPGAPPSNPAPPTSPPSAEAQPTQSAPAAAPKSKEETVKEVVSAEFPTYDADKSGDLNRAEFGKWVTTLREQTMAQQGKASSMTEPEKASWIKNAFTKADTDKSKKVSQSELETFLLG